MTHPPEERQAAARPAPDMSPLRLLEDVPTPLVAYDLAVLRDRAAALRRALPAGSTLLYSLKANPLPPLVAALAAVVRAMAARP